MKVKIISVTDLNGTKLCKNLWENERIVIPYPVEIGKAMSLQNIEDDSKSTITNEILAIQDGLGKQKQYYTRYKIYTLEEMGGNYGV